jgi:hypothetical protein
MKFIFVNGRWLSSVFTISTFCRFCISRSRLVSGRRGEVFAVGIVCIFYVWHRLGMALGDAMVSGRFSII